MILVFTKLEVSCRYFQCRFNFRGFSLWLMVVCDDNCVRWWWWWWQRNHRLNCDDDLNLCSLYFQTGLLSFDKNLFFVYSFFLSSTFAFSRIVSSDCTLVLFFFAVQEFIFSRYFPIFVLKSVQFLFVVVLIILSCCTLLWFFVRSLWTRVFATVVIPLPVLTLFLPSFLLLLFLLFYCNNLIARRALDRSRFFASYH